MVVEQSVRHLGLAGARQGWSAKLPNPACRAAGGSLRVGRPEAMPARLRNRLNIDPAVGAQPNGVGARFRQGWLLQDQPRGTHVPRFFAFTRNGRMRFGRPVAHGLLARRVCADLCRCVGQPQ